MMDTITSAIITALAAGIGETGKEMVKDAYNALKSALKRKYGKDSDVIGAVVNLEKKPTSAGRQETLQEEMASAKADQDEDILKAARALQAEINQISGDGDHIMSARGNFIAQADRGGTATVTVSKA